MIFYEIKTSKKTMRFYHESDYLHMMDYINNGLKLIYHQDREYRFNNGDRLFDVSIRNNPKKWVVETSNGKRLTSDKLIKKYLVVIEKEA